MPANDPDLTLYFHPLAAYCWKALIALHENATPFHGEVIDLSDPASRAKLLALWPLGKFPVLRDAVRDEVIPETSIIIEYLQQHYPGSAALIPADPDWRLKVRLWDRFFDLYVSTPMQQLVSGRMRPEGQKDPVGAAAAEATLDTAYAILERRIASRSWATGDGFTLADCSAAPALFYAEAVRPFSPSYPSVAGYFERLVTHPSVRRTISAARPYFPLFPFHEALDPRFTAPEF